MATTNRTPQDVFQDLSETLVQQGADAEEQRKAILREVARAGADLAAIRKGVSRAYGVLLAVFVLVPLVLAMLAVWRG